MSVREKRNSNEFSQSDLFIKISDICTAVNEVLTTKELLEVSLKKTMDLFSARRGSIFILKENGKDLILRAAEGIKKSEEIKIVKQLGEGIVGKVAELKKPVFVDDIGRDERFRDLKGSKGYRTPSFICAPLLIKDQLIGVINIADKESGYRFNEKEMQFLDFLATQTALNYRRVKLYQKFKLTEKETKSLKSKLGQSDQETEHLKKQIFIQEKLASIGKLTGGIAHEFNNPLDGVMRYTNLCLEHVRDDEVVKGYLLEIKYGLNRMANIVKNLLACSRDEFPNRDKVEFERALDHSLSEIHGEIARFNIKIKRNIDQGIPLIRDLGLEIILTNLLRNAMDSMGQGGTIMVQAKYQDQQLVIDISDTGKGIPYDKVDQIFEPFYTTKDMAKGCGLGLTIVGEIVKRYEGKIHVQSEPGQGTTFSINLPVENES